MEDKLDQVINKVVDTFAFHGVKIVSMNFSPDKGDPSFTVSVSKKKRSKSLEETLDFVYWTLWTLIYGTYEKSKDHLKINLDYEEVE